MDWANEHYVRVYTRDTTNWKRLRWSGQCVLVAILRKLDAAGVMDIEDMEPWEAVELHCGAPQDQAKEGMAACLRLGALIHQGTRLISPKFEDAQWANKSDKQRQKESRARRRAQPVASVPPAPKSVTPGDNGVTPRDEPVTAGHTPSQAVTPPPVLPVLPVQPPHHCVWWTRIPLATSLGSGR